MRFVSISLSMIAITIGSAFSVEACGSSSSGDENEPSDAGTNDAANSDSGANTDAAVDDTALGALMPQVKRFEKNAVLATPKVVVITYDNDNNRSDVEAFYTAFAASDAFAAQTQEYGVGTLTVSAPIHIEGTAPTALDDTQITTMLSDNLSSTPPDGGVSWGAPDPSTLYAFVFPPGTIVDDGTGEKCCDAFDGYHDETSASGVSIAYSIVCACAGFDGPGVSTLGQITVAASHETVEAVTDPFPQTDPAYADADDPHIAWSYVTGGEVADMCELADTAYWTPTDLPYTIQRTWSNAQALAGRDPCVGAPMATYYQTVPTLPDSASIYDTTTKALKTTVGTATPLTLTVYGDPGSGPFNVGIEDAFGEGFVSATVPTGPFNVGDTITAQVTMKSVDPSLGNAATFMIVTTPTTGKKDRSTYFFGFLVQ